MTNTKYSLLFTVELLHKYFKDRLCTDFNIIPSEQTKEVLNGYKLVAKQYMNRLYAALLLDKNGNPQPKPEEGMQLTFFLELNNRLFFNYTNLPFTSLSGKVYYFSNRNTNVSNGRQFLSLQYAPYNNGKQYKPGDQTINASGTVFEASRTSTAVQPPVNNGASDFWIQIDPVASQNHYTSENDALQWLPSISPYHFNTVQTSANIKVFGYNPATSDYSLQVFSNAIGFLKPVLGFTLNLSKLKPGKYKLQVNGTEKLVYINDELSRRRVFAVIDIFNESTLAAPYKLMNGPSLVNPSPAFSIYFLNRSTIWKYVLPAGINGVITDVSGNFKFPVSAANNVYSVSTIPLRDNPLDFKLKVGGSPSVVVGSASPQRLATCIHFGETYYCSEIFINY